MPRSWSRWTVFAVSTVPVKALFVLNTDFRRRVQSMGIEEVITAARSPWQTPYIERMIGSIRRECLDNVVVLSERHLRRILKDYFSHYHRWRCHQSLEMDCPEPRPVQPPDVGEVVEVVRGRRSVPALRAPGCLRREDLAPLSRVQCAAEGWRGSHHENRVRGERR